MGEIDPRDFRPRTATEVLEVTPEGEVRRYDADLERRFTYHAPKGNQAVKYSILRSMAKSFAYLIRAMCPSSREESLALTKLEEAVFWANAAIARNE